MVERRLLEGSFSQGDADIIYRAIKDDGDFLTFMRTYLYDADICVVRKALWGMTHATKMKLRRLQPMLQELMGFAMRQDDASARRMTLSIIERMAWGEKDLRSDFLDFCLEQMVSLETPVAIQALSMKLSYRMCQYYPDLMDELMRTLEFMDMEYYSPAVKSVRRRIYSKKGGMR